MGREVRNFKQTGGSRTGNFQTRNNAGVNRAGYWGKIIDSSTRTIRQMLKKGGKV